MSKFAMVIESHGPKRVAFGPFEVNTATGELTKNGVRIRLAGQPLQVLQVLLSRPGEVVSSDELRRKLWGDGTFVDFEHGLHAAINKLRRALSDSADNARYIETVAGVGYRFIGPIAPEAPKKAPKKQTTLWLWLYCAVACLASFAIGRWSQRPPAAAKVDWKFTRLTSSAHLADSPALSPDGRLVAYSSDEDPSGGRDIYIKHVAGGAAIRLTFDGEGNTTPSFSPDGAKIVFRSNRNGGGVYEIPALGGAARLVAHHGLNPRYSPDGTRVAFWIGGEGLATAVPGGGAVWVVPVAGGEPERVAADLTAARYPIWSPDGKRLLMVGYASKKAYDLSALDWWLAPLSGQTAVKTGVYEAASRTGIVDSDPFGNVMLPGPIANAPIPYCWPAGNNVVFSTQKGDTQSIWEIALSTRTGKLEGDFRRLTVGAGSEAQLSCSSTNELAFAHLEEQTGFWALPMDLNRSVALGPPEPLVESPRWEEYPALSADGQHLAFTAYQFGNDNIWLRDLRNGEETRLASSPFRQRYPIMDAAGRLAYSSYENGRRFIYLVTPGGPPEKLCQDCLRATDWARDGKSLLTFGGNPYRIGILEIARRRQMPILQHPTHSLLYAHFSPDNLWISFTERMDTGRSRIMLAPLDGSNPVPENAWVQISEETDEDWANWSPDGHTLYFTSARDGHYCVWGQRIDSLSHRPVGDAFAVWHLHGHNIYRQRGWSVAAGKIVVALYEDKGNIWLMSRGT